MKTIYRNTRILSTTLLSAIFLSIICISAHGDAVRTRLSDGVPCISISDLSRWLPAKAQIRRDGAGAHIAFGKQTLDLETGTVLASGPQGPLMLPTCPIFVDAELYAPTQAVVKALGGRTVSTAEGIQINYGSRSLMVPPATETTSADGGDTITQDLNDPKVPLKALASDSSRSNTIHQYASSFTSVVATVQPSVEIVRNSKVLMVLSYVPVVGSLVSTLRTLATALDMAVIESKKLVQTDAESGRPVRIAVIATGRLLSSHTDEQIQPARPLWSSALPALDKQVEQNSQMIAQIDQLTSIAGVAESKIQGFNRDHPKERIISPIRPLFAAADRFKLSLKASVWQERTLKRYFQKLLSDTESTQH
jgi:hypothetical protein